MGMANGRTTKWTVKEFSPGQMDANMMATGRTENNTARVSITQAKEKSKWANGLKVNALTGLTIGTETDLLPFVLKPLSDICCYSKIGNANYSLPYPLYYANSKFK